MDNLRPIAAIFFAALALATLTHVPLAKANSELDHRFALSTIGALKSWDNVDGLFGEYVLAAYKEYFSKQSRFRLQDFTKADAILASSKLPYNKAIEDPEILGQLSRSLRTESILRTRILKEGADYRFTIDWLHSPQMEIMSTETFTLTEPGARHTRAGESAQGNGDFPGLGDIRGSLKVALDRMFGKVPWLANVTGRDNNSATVNIGALAKLKPGDTLVIGTIDDMKKHPLLRSIVDWRITPTGRLIVEQADEGIAFCKVLNEEEGKQIARLQKVIQIIPKTELASQAEVIRESEIDPTLDETPRLGFLMGSLLAGNMSRQYSTMSGTTGKSGGGMLIGASGLGEVWFNKEFFANLGLSYSSFAYSQSDIATGVADTAVIGGTSIFGFKLGLGYSFLLTGDFFGPKAWIKAGYNSNSYTFPTIDTSFTAPFSEKAFFLGLGGDLPIRNNWGARLELEFGLLNSASETSSLNGSVSSASHARIYFGGYYRYKARITFQAGFEIQADGADFDSGASLSHKTYNFIPSVLYYF